MIHFFVQMTEITPTIASYLFGGWYGYADPFVIQKYDGVTRSNFGTNITYGTTGCSAAIGADAFMFGGSTTLSAANATTQVKKFTGTALTTVGSSMSTARVRVSAATLSSVAYIFGSMTNTTVLATIYSFNGTTNSTTAYSLTNAGSANLLTETSAAVLATTAYIFGGCYPLTSGTCTSMIRTFTGTASSTSGATLSAATSGTTASALGSYIYIFGGYNGTTYVNMIQKFNGTTRTTESATLANTLTSSASTTNDTNIFIFGGRNASYTNLIQRYDGTTRTTDSAVLANSYNVSAASGYSNGAVTI